MKKYKIILFIVLGVLRCLAQNQPLIVSGKSDSFRVHWYHNWKDVEGQDERVTHFQLGYIYNGIDTVIAGSTPRDNVNFRPDKSYCFHGLRNGKYVFLVRAIDRTGNKSEWHKATESSANSGGWIYENTYVPPKRFVFQIIKTDAQYWFFKISGKNELNTSIRYIDIKLTDGSRFDWLQGSGFKVTPPLGEKNNTGIESDSIRITFSGSGLLPGQSIKDAEGDLDGAETSFNGHAIIELDDGRNFRADLKSKDNLIWKAVFGSPIDSDTSDTIVLGNTTKINLIGMTGKGAVNVSQKQITLEQGNTFIYQDFSIPSSWRYDICIECSAEKSAELGISIDADTLGHHTAGPELQIQSFTAMLSKGEIRLKLFKMQESSTLTIHGITIHRFIPIEGDTDLDGDVDDEDKDRISKMFGKSVPKGTPEDIDHDGDVDGLDLARLSKNFGKSKQPACVEE
jgi:hypothetical protein